MILETYTILASEGINYEASKGIYIVILVVGTLIEVLRNAGDEGR